MIGKEAGRGEVDTATYAATDAVRAALDPAYFSEARFAWTPYAYQRDVLDAVLLHGKRRICWVAGRRVGKTEGVANLVLQLAVKRPGIQIAIFAPSFRQASILSRKIRHMLAGSKWTRNVAMDNVGELRLRFGHDKHGKPRDSVILTMSLSGKVRGEGADVLIIDESAFCNPEDYRNKALPFIADRPDAIVIHISTVWAEDDHFMEAHRLYQELPHGAVFITRTRDKPGVTEEMLEEFRRSMLRSEYEREYECRLVPEGGVFDRRALARCLEDYELLDLARLSELEVQRHHYYLIGVDWGKFQDRAVIAVVEQPTQHKINQAKLVMLEVYEPDPENDSFYTTVLQDVLRVARHTGAQRVVADQGEGAHQAEVLTRELGGRFVPFRFTAASRDFLVDNARFLVEKGLVRLPLEPDEVRRAFLNVQPTEKGYEHPDRRLKDVFDAVALACSEARQGEQRQSMGLLTARRAGPPGRIPLS